MGRRVVTKAPNLKLSKVAKSCFLALSITSINSFAAEENSDKRKDKEIEVIEVTGIKESLSSAMNMKRSTDNIVEVINSEDVGKLPDNNLAEVLENITGIQIDRTSGVGSSVSIRGSDQNRVEVNGRGTAPAEDARGGISFEDLPASLIASVVVTKVPTADMVEGSLGGTIDLKTYRGLSLSKPIRSITTKAEYAENRDEWGPSISGTFGDKFQTDFGEIGVVFSANHQVQKVREDSLNVRVGTRGGIDLDQFGGPGDGTSAPDTYLRPTFAQQFFSIEDRTTDAFSGSIEWQANDDLKLFVDATLTRAETDRRGHGAFLGQPGARGERDHLDSATFDVFTANGVSIPIISSTQVDGIQLRSTNSSLSRETDTDLFALGGEWIINDSLDMSFELSDSESDTFAPQFSLVTQFQNPDASNINSAGSRQRINFYYDNTGDLAYGPADDFTGDLSDPNSYAVFVARDRASYFENSDSAQKIDFSWYFNNNVFSNLEFGLRTSQRDSTRDRIVQSSANFPGLAQGDLAPFLSQTPTDFFDFNSGASYLDGFLTGDPSQLKNLEEIRSALGISLAPDPDRTQYFGVSEDTLAGYAKLNIDTEIFGDMQLTGNVGVRVVQTEQTADGFRINNGVAEDISEKQDYTETLPSMSLVLAVSEETLVRFGAAKILRRPDFGDLSPTVNFPLNSNPVQGGNPQLSPTTAKQYDLSVEHYYGEASYFSAGIFFKDIDEVVGSEVIVDGIYNPNAIDSEAPEGSEPGNLVDLILPVNQTGGEIKGIELAVQHTFDNLPSPLDGLGLSANYTYQDGERDASFTLPGFLQGEGETVELDLNFRNLSENSYNITVFYEKHGFNARVRYTYRDAFLREEAIDLANGLPFYQDDRGQLNASVSYDINDSFSVTLSGVNLTKETFDERAIFEDGPLVQQRDADRRYVLGVRARF